jgi:hypothetical protein
LSFGRVDWLGNYRRGLKAEAELYNSHTFYPEAYFRNNWNNSLSLEVQGHLPLARFFGLSGRGGLRHWFNDPNKEGGKALRGILDDEIHARTLLFLNMEFPFRLLRFYPSELLENEKLRLFNFELHGSPFLDLALVKGSAGDPGGAMREISFSPGDIFCAGGLELIVYPSFMRSLYLRASFGYNLRELGDGLKWDELVIVLGHHY